MAWSLIGNIQGPEGPEGPEGPAGVVAGNVTRLRVGVSDIQTDANENVWIDLGATFPTAPTGGMAIVDTVHGGGAEGWHCTVSDFRTDAFMVHVDDSTDDAQGKLIRLHWIVWWTD